ncbi:PAS domain S-box protein [Paenibacillus faecalis]|uniref:PAS domain-containing sensor histidine kinase n=1 Tax=Paenibacillus faecalis TaxID=2079532 RepID=UPI000D103FAA|nr:PAS domain S-box protein [Paenibacillus faecalis]
MGLKYIILSLLQQFFNVIIVCMLCHCCSSNIPGYCRHWGTSRKYSLFINRRYFRCRRKRKRSPERCQKKHRATSYYEKKYKECLKRYGRWIEHYPQPMIVQNNEKVIFINSAGVKYFGLGSPTELVGKPIYDILKSDEIHRVRKQIDYRMTHKYKETIDYKVMTRKGPFIKAEVTEIYDEHTGSTIYFFYDVTERKKIEEALRESRERYRKLVELSPIAIAVAKDGQLIYSNPRGIQILGASGLSDIVGTSPWSWVVNKDDEWAETVQKELWKNGNVSLEEVKVRRINGDVIDILASAILDYQSGTIEIVIEDITESKQVAQALMDSEQFNRQLIEISPVAMLLHKNYICTYVNPKALSLLGASDSKDVIGRSVLDLVHMDSKALVIDYLDEIYKGRGAIQLGEHRILRLDGEVIDAEAVSASVPFKGGDTFLTIIRDITEQKRVEKERKNAEDRIRKSEERYFQLQMSLDKFSSDLFGMVKVMDLNKRFVEEVCRVLLTDRVSFIEMDDDSNVTITHGYDRISHHMMETLQKCSVKNLPPCEMVSTCDGYFVKIGEVQGKSCILCIGEDSPFPLVQAKKVWLETISRYVSVLYDNFRVIEDLTKELEKLSWQQSPPVWLLRFMFQLSENERKHLAQDLHDSALQEQIIWYRRLDQLLSEKGIPEHLHQELECIKQGLLDVIYQIRITCNELRPPLLQEVGLEGSLHALFEFTQLRSDFAIQFDCSNVSHIVDDDLMIGLYRIVQEMLANASKHSKATQVIIKLYSDNDLIHLYYEDNGIGMNVKDTISNLGSMGVYGVKERVRSMDGEIEFISFPDQGLSIVITVPNGSSTVEEKRMEERKDVSDFIGR